MDNTNNLANVVLTVVEEWEKLQYGMCCADAVHKLDIALEELAALQAQLNVVARDRSFYKSCALSGEVPKDGDEPSAREIAGWN